MQYFNYSVFNTETRKFNLENLNILDQMRRCGDELYNVRKWKNNHKKNIN